MVLPSSRSLRSVACIIATNGARPEQRSSLPRNAPAVERDHPHASDHRFVQHTQRNDISGANHTDFTTREVSILRGGMLIDGRIDFLVGTASITSSCYRLPAFGGFWPRTFPTTRERERTSG